MHRYTPIITHSEGGGGEDEKPPIAVPPTSIRSLATTALLMLVSGITGALILSLIQRHASTVSMAASTPQLERLQNLLSGTHWISTGNRNRALVQKKTARSNQLTFVVPLETVKFMPDDVFAAPASPQTDEAWMEMLGRESCPAYAPGHRGHGKTPANVVKNSASKGFIALENPEDYGLAPGRSLQNSTHQVYGVTMFHELHCLVSRRRRSRSVRAHHPSTPLC